MRRPLVCAVLVLACGESAAPAAPPTSAAPACAAPRVDVPAAAGLPSSEQLARRLQEIVARDFDADACLVRAVVRSETVLVEATHGTETVRARLASSMGSPTESLAPHVAAARRLRSLLDAGVESALSSGRGVALGFSDHAALCYRAVGSDPTCVRADPVRAFDSVTEPSVRRLVVRALSDPEASTGVEWELTLGDASALSARTGPMQPARALGAPPPEPDRFVRVRSASARDATPTPDTGAAATAASMPPGAATVRLETREAGGTRVLLFSRCEGMLAHCASIVGAGEGGALRLSASFASEPARIDAVEDASAFAPGALRVRVREAGFHEASASELVLVTRGDALAAHEVALGRETERGEEETVTEGCYRSLTLEAPSRARLSDPRGWSGSHTDARGWHVVPSTTCASESVLCLDPEAGFGPCT